MPSEVENLLEIIAIKRSCRDAGIEKLEAGPKGAVVSLRDNRFANPAGLVDLIQRHAARAAQPDAGALPQPSPGLVMPRAAGRA